MSKRDRLRTMKRAVKVKSKTKGEQAVADKKIPDKNNLETGKFFIPAANMLMRTAQFT